VTLTAEDIAIGQRRWLAFRRAGQGCEEWKQAQDHWHAWAFEHGVELMNTAAQSLGVSGIEDEPQNMVTKNHPATTDYEAPPQPEGPDSLARNLAERQGTAL